jgi:hypothetical protein
MSAATVVKFMQKTAEDKLLREQLETLLGVGDGNISNDAELDAEESAALKSDHADTVAEIAAHYGYEFSADDLLTVVDALEKHQSGALSEAGFTQLVGVKVPKTLNPIRKLVRFMGRTYLGI